MNVNFNPNVINDLLRLRDEMDAKAFTKTGAIMSTAHAEFFYKLNSVLYKGYPRNTGEIK